MATKILRLNATTLFFWGCYKDKVYENWQANIEDLKKRIKVETDKISAETIGYSIYEFYHRLGACQVEGGGHFQHILVDSTEEGFEILRFSYFLITT